MAEKTAKGPKVDTFLWDGTNKSGAAVKGEITAPSISMAKAELRNQGIIPKRVRKKPKPLFGKRQKKITPQDIAVFSRQMSTMMTAGVPLVQSFDVMGRGHSNESMQKLIMTVKADVESGTSLHESLAKHPRQFDELYCNLVDAGEQSGSLETMLGRIAAYKERLESLKKKIKKAMTYPIIVLVVALVVSAVLLIFVVPQFETLFNSFGADLPAFTRMVLNLSDFLQAYWYIMVGVIVAAGYAFTNAKRRSAKFRHNLDRLSLKIPIIGPILEKAAIANYARTLAITFAAGLPLVDALKSVSKTVGNSVYTDAVLRIRDEVAIGHRIQFAMRMTNVFPNMVEQMVGIGEESGSLDSMLNKVADFYEEEVNNAVDNLSSLLEPMIMVILGVLVGGLIAAMYLPIFKLGTVI